MNGSGNVLRRIARPAEPPVTTPARALRLATVRAAQASVNLTLGVLGIAEESGPLDDLLSRLEEGLLIFALGSGDGLVGLDAEGMSAAVEAQTLGRVAAQRPPLRAPTRVDEALVAPLLAAVLAEVGTALGDTALSGWLREPGLGSRVAGSREAAMALPDGDYRAVRLTLDLGGEGRQGMLVILARVLPPSRTAAPDRPGGEEDRIADRVLAAPAPLRAVLGRLSLPIAAVEALAVGQILPLNGLTVASVRIESGGRNLGPARLGQVAGMRAVRLESPLAPRLDDLPPLGGEDGPAALGR